VVHPLALAIVTAGMLTTGVACQRAADRLIDAGFWFEPVTFSSPRLQGPVTELDIKTIESVARAELARAFDGLRMRWNRAWPLLQKRFGGQSDSEVPTSGP
jgi:hypothetical protein